MKIMLVLIIFLLFVSTAFAATVTVEYSASSPELCKKYCVYKNEASYTFGFASASALNITDGMSLESEVTDDKDDLLIILTQPQTEISAREVFLKENTFDELINPSFGYPIIDVFSIMLGLQYNNIYLKSVALSQGIGSGIYSLVFKNNGTISSGPGAGSTEVIVEVI